MNNTYGNVQPVSSKAKDTLFKKVYESEERLKGLAGFLLGCDVDDIKIQNIKPVVYGNKENDLGFSCARFLYLMMEEQSTVCMNLAFRVAEYMITALRESVDTEKLLYGTTRVKLPYPKLYGVNVGIVYNVNKLPETVTYDMRLSASYEVREGFEEICKVPDLEAVVHMYDYRMTLAEVGAYLKDEIIPDRFEGHQGDLFNYALTANSITYIQKQLIISDRQKQQFPEKVTSLPDLFKPLGTAFSGYFLSCLV